jgi:hypothetical protein
MNVKEFESSLDHLVEKYVNNKSNEITVVNFERYWLYLKKFSKDGKTYNTFYYETFPDLQNEIAVYRENMFNINDNNKYEKLNENYYTSYRELYNELSKVVSKKLWKVETNERNQRIKQQIAYEKKEMLRGIVQQNSKWTDLEM